MTTIPPEAMAFGDQVHAQTAAGLEAGVRFAREICNFSNDDMQVMIYLFAQMREFAPTSITPETLMLTLSLALVRMARTGVTV